MRRYRAELENKYGSRLQKRLLWVEDGQVVSSVAYGAKKPRPSITGDHGIAAAYPSLVRIFSNYILAEDAFEKENGTFYSTSKREFNPGSFYWLIIKILLS